MITCHLLAVCYEALGMASEAIANNQISTSSGEGLGRMGGQSWHPDDDTPSITIEFPVLTEIRELQVAPDGDKYYEKLSMTYTGNGGTTHELLAGNGEPVDNNLITFENDIFITSSNLCQLSCDSGAA